jgi:dolichol-phosphate mannosyltransferase
MRSTSALEPTLIPGDHAFQNEGIARMFKAAGAADIVITYRDNQSDRSVNRSIQSHSLRLILNCLFGFWLSDYHSMIIYPVNGCARSRSTSMVTGTRSAP